jgi:hypothetical protein
VEAHQVTIGGLVQWIVLQQALRVGDGSAVLALFLKQQNQSLKGVAVGLMVPLAQGKDPIVVTVGQ